MAWTAWRTWVAGETVTAAFMNAQIRDNGKALSDPWGAYTPTWTAATTNPVLGNGTLTGNFLQVGKWVRYRLDLVIGSTTTVGTGGWFFTLPVAPVVGPTPVGSALAYNVPGSTLYPRLAFTVGSGTSTFAVADMAAARVGAGAPFTWAATTELHIHGFYESV